MMNLKPLIVILMLAIAPATANAQTAEETIIVQLRAQGFEDLTITRTWLGRIRILALSADLRREIVFNPTTGEILRDYWQELDGTSVVRGPLLVDPNGSNDDNRGPTGVTEDNGGPDGGTDDNSGPDGGTDSSDGESGSDSGDDGNQNNDEGGDSENGDGGGAD